MATSQGQQHSNERGNANAAARLPLKILEDSRREPQDPTSPPSRPNSSRPLYSPGTAPSPGGKMYSPTGHAVRRHDGTPFPPEDTMSFAPSEDSFLEREFMSTSRVSPRMHMYSNHQPCATVFPVPPHLQFVEDWRNAAHNVPPPMEQLDPSLPSPRYSLEPYALHPAGSHHSSVSCEVEAREEFPMYQLDLFQPAPSGGKVKSTSKGILSKMKKGLGLTPRKQTSSKGAAPGLGKKAEVSEAEVEQLLEGGIALELRYDSATPPIEKTRSEQDEMSLSSEGRNSPPRPKTKAPEAPKPAAPRVVVPKLPLKVVASDCAAADAVGELASAAVTATEDAPARAERLSDSANPVGTHRTQLAPVSHRSHEELPYKPSASSHPSQAAMADKVPKSATLAYPSASGQSRFVPSSGAREAPRVAAQAPQNSCQNYDERPLSHTRAAPPPALVTPPRPAPQHPQTAPFSPAGSSIPSNKRADPNGVDGNFHGEGTATSPPPIPTSSARVPRENVTSADDAAAVSRRWAHASGSWRELHFTFNHQEGKGPGAGPAYHHAKPRRPVVVARPPDSPLCNGIQFTAEASSAPERIREEERGLPWDAAPPSQAAAYLHHLPADNASAQGASSCAPAPSTGPASGAVARHCACSGRRGRESAGPLVALQEAAKSEPVRQLSAVVEQSESRTRAAVAAQRAELARARDVAKNEMKKLEHESPARVMEPQKTPPISPAKEASQNSPEPVHSHSPHYAHVFETPGPAVSEMSSQPSTPGTSLSGSKRAQISKQLQWHHNSRAPFQKTPISQHQAATRDLPDASTQAQATPHADAQSGGPCSIAQAKGKTSKPSSRQQSPTKRRMSVSSDPSDAVVIQVSQVGASAQIPTRIAKNLKQKAAGLLRKQDGSAGLSLGMGLAVGAGLGVVVGLVSGLGFVLSKRLSEKESKQKEHDLPHLQRMEQSLMWALSNLPKVPIGGHTDSRRSNNNGRNDRDKDRHVRTNTH
eukprot:CAMPEP_0114282070 /NCGR_PEP_ID=MMETSP0059-20121206/3359_1 /TAXON_ID=36894 /ORGANISM="Pyramimonas parkeae, Strain CCMP726" /LENGTH=988 /DNA_ID=CAMNT_0001402681 /DNA_START=134 /DNA_END=3100 /DNA_ORIENTATION=-